MTSDFRQRNLHILGQLVKGIVSDRFKRMAKGEVLTRFSSVNIDPALLVDLAMQTEREALALTDMSLLDLVTPDRLASELRRSSLRIQNSYQEIYGESVVENFSSEPLVDLRLHSLRTRIDFYNPFLSIHSDVNDSLELAVMAFNRAERFQKSLSTVIESDRNYFDELIRQSNSMYRFMIRKQCDHELLKAEESWLEFKTEAFKKPQELP